jgi:hypothetical protein
MEKINHSWMNDPILGTAKALLGYAGPKLIERNGGELRNRYSRHVAKNEMAQVVGDLIPAAMPRLKEVYPKGEPAALVGWRSRAVIEGGEHETFLRPSFRSTLDLVMRAWDKQKQISVFDIHSVIERELIIRHGDGPGVYFRRDPEGANRVYVGITGDAADRNKGHNNSPLRMGAIFSTQDKRTAQYIEGEIHLELRQHPDLVYAIGRGLFIFKPHVDAFALAHVIFEAKRFSRLVFHNRNQVIEKITQPEPAMLPMMSAF